MLPACFAALHGGRPSILGRFWRYLNIEEEMVRLVPQLDHAIDEQEEREERACGAKEEYKPC